MLLPLPACTLRPGTAVPSRSDDTRKVTVDNGFDQAGFDRLVADGVIA